jgi:hypothetical protein
MAAIRATVLVLSALFGVAAAHAQSAPGMEGMTVGPSYTRGTNVYPDTGGGPPGSAVGDLLNYRRHHSRHESKDQICPGAQDDCAPVDIDVTFSGETALGVDVIPDAFRVIAGIGAEELSCRTLSAVKAEVLTAADVPPNDLAKAAAPPTDYERWTATLCGQQVAFLLGVWPAKTEPSPFRIVYPFAP